MEIKSLTIYCSSSNNLKNKYYDLSVEIGQFLGKKNIKIIYGGGSIGMMGYISRSAMSVGGKVVGVIPKFLDKKEIINNDITETIIVNTMSERKEKLFQLGDAILILPGGSGTIEEATEIISWKFLGIHKKNIIIYNYDNYWSHLLDMYKKAEENNFGNKFTNTNLQSICDNISSFEEFVSLFSQ
tara:strand:- start:20 stop:574 length:555 start_codon:yes stop_codon:yes gene_type:complete